MNNQATLPGGRARAALCWLWILLLSQPVLDAVSFWTADVGWGSTLTLALRMAVLAATVVLAFVLSERRRCYVLTAAVLAAYWLAHALACLRVGYAEPITDLTNYIRVAQLPVYTLAFITLLRRVPDALDRVEQALAAALWLTALITLLALATGTNNPTYPKWGIGVCAWFALPNSQSAIYGVLTLVTVCSAIRRGQPLRAILRCAVGFALLFLLGTRLAYAEIFAITLAVLVSMALTRTLDRRVFAAVLALAILSGALYSLSPMYRNRQSYAESADVQQADAADTIEQTPPPPQAYDWLPDAEESIDVLYRQYQPLMVRRFGLERVKTAFGYTDNVELLGDLRLCKILFCRMAMDELPITSRLFGFELSTTVYEGGIFDVENDFHGMYFLYGIVGLALIVGYLLVFAVRALKRMLREPNRYFTLPVCAYSAAALILIINAYFSASVLRRPNASVYLSVTLAVLWLLTERQDHSSEENV
ncbi:MAG: O-antigen ligase family protein [Oscillospiraceae bacterium]|nr:O-antigen ligase family protein [Oscillospiraceae bacterium]